MPSLPKLDHRSGLLRDRLLPVHLTQQELVDTVQSLVEQGQEYVQSNALSLAGEVLSNVGSIVDV